MRCVQLLAQFARQPPDIVHPKIVAQDDIRPFFLRRHETYVHGLNGLLQLFQDGSARAAA